MPLTTSKRHPAEALEQVLGLLSRHRIACSTEAQLQAGVERVFAAAGLPHEPFYRLSDEDIIDLKVGSVGLELKVKGSLAEVTRQLHRYAQHEEIAALVLVTTRAAHRRAPAALNRKPVRVHFLMENTF